MSEFNEHHHPFVHVDQSTLLDTAGETIHRALHAAGSAITYLTGATVQLVRHSTDQARH